MRPTSRRRAEALRSSGIRGYTSRGRRGPGSRRTGDGPPRRGAYRLTIMPNPPNERDAERGARRRRARKAPRGAPPVPDGPCRRRGGRPRRRCWPGCSVPGSAGRAVRVPRSPAAIAGGTPTAHARAEHVPDSAGRGSRRPDRRARRRARRRAPPRGSERPLASAPPRLTARRPRHTGRPAAGVAGPAAEAICDPRDLGRDPVGRRPKLAGHVRPGGRRGQDADDPRQRVRAGLDVEDLHGGRRAPAGRGGAADPRRAGRAPAAGVSAGQADHRPDAARPHQRPAGLLPQPEDRHGAAGPRPTPTWTPARSWSYVAPEAAASRARHWLYSNTNYLLLGELVSAVTGHTLAAEVRQPPARPARARPPRGTRSSRSRGRRSRSGTGWWPQQRRGSAPCRSRRRAS